MIVAGLLLHLLLAPADSGAVPFPAVVLSVTLPPECPSIDEVRGGVAARLGRDPFVTTGPAAVRVLGAREGDQLVVHVQALQDGVLRGERTEAGPAGSCAELAARVELAVAVLLDPDLTPFDAPPVVDVLDAAPVTPAAASTPPAAPVHRVGRAPAHTDALTPLVPHLRVGVFGLMGRQPLAGVGAAGAAAVDMPVTLGPVDHLRGMLELRATLPLTVAVPGGTVGAQETSLALLPCVGIGVGEACVGGEAGLLTAFGSGLPRAAVGTLPAASALARIGLLWPVAPGVAALVRADFAVPVIQHALLGAGEPTATYFTTAPFAVGLALGASFDLRPAQKVPKDQATAPQPPDSSPFTPQSPPP